jgi:hypothetical protein
MWIALPDAITMYARFCQARYGAAATQRVREKARELQRKGDMQGHRIWNDVAHEIERSAVTHKLRNSASAATQGG